jgi:signal transduction histidine kinase
VKEILISSIFAPELHSRLNWFVRLRWLPAAGLAIASVVGKRLGFDSVWPSLFVVASFISIYNIFFYLSLRSRSARGRYDNLRVWAISQMAMDLVALAVTIHFTGGMQSPGLPFFAFHMAIGTIMIKNRIMYLFATATSAGIILLFALEERGVLATHPLDPAYGISTTSSYLNLLMLIALIYSMVYLTASVTGRFKERSIELHKTTVALRERTNDLQSLLAEKDELERQKSHYMRISAHQLRSPLGTIKTTLQVLLDGYLDPASERGRRLLAGAADRVVDLITIVNDLLELAKMREGRAKAPWTQQVYVNQILADIFDTLQPFADERKVKLVPEMAGVALLAWGVPPDLVYAFENLVHNAIKYSKEGGTVKVRLWVDEENATVTVSDQGIGIPDTLQQDVFLEFVRAPNAKHYAAEGTGLGLSIVRQAIQGHGGEVTVESREDEGTTFTVTLPMGYVPKEVESLHAY